MRPDERKRLVEAGYDAMAEKYLASKREGDPALLDALDRFATRLPVGAAVLDLGCGAGVPATRLLVERGFRVTGVDISARQLELARALVPGADFVQADMASLDLPPASCDGVVSLYALIHVPREEQPVLLARISSWLRPSGSFLATWALTEWEGAEEDWQGWGASMWWSHYGQEENFAMLRRAGLAVEWAEARENADGERWLWALASSCSPASLPASLPAPA